MRPSARCHTRSGIASTLSSQTRGASPHSSQGRGAQLSTLMAASCSFEGATRRHGTSASCRPTELPAPLRDRMGSCPRLLHLPISTRELSPGGDSPGWQARRIVGLAAELSAAVAPHGAHAKRATQPSLPYGWVCVVGDQIAWTMLSGGSGIVGVTSMEGTTHRLGTTHFPTVHRDRSAERARRRVVAVNIAKGDAPVNGQVAEIVLDGPSPELRVLRGGALPGASVCEGSVVGYWKPTRTLQLPGGLWVHMPPGSAVTDVISDGEWCAGTVFGAPDRMGGAVTVLDLFHLPTGADSAFARCLLESSIFGRERILWTWRADGAPKVQPAPGLVTCVHPASVV